MEDLPLTINGLQGCSPVFRYTDVFPPLATVRRPDDDAVLEGDQHLILEEEEEIAKVPLYLSPIVANMQLSTSGKWPDNLEAIRKTKAAFYIQIAETVRKQFGLLAHGGTEFLDIFKDGLVFRFRIAHQKEIALIKQQTTKGVIKYRDTEESLELEKQLFHLPKISGALCG